MEKIFCGNSQIDLWVVSEDEGAKHAQIVELDQQQEIARSQFSETATRTRLIYNTITKIHRSLT
jgi:hypothetical protein